MKKALFAVSSALTILAATFLVASSDSADGITKSKADVTFNKDVAPILFKNCVECHRPGEAAPMSLLRYKDARPWARSIREKVLSREMPPWHADPRVGQFSNDPRLTQAEIDTITAWVDGGAKEGEPRDLPPSPKFVEGWNIGQPDLILKMPEEFTLDANGPDEYQHFVIDPGFTEDKYVEVAEARPGNRRIVHHIIAAILPPPEGAQPQMTPTREEIEKMRAERDPILYKEGFLRRRSGQGRNVAHRVRSRRQARAQRAGHGQEDSRRLEDPLAGPLLQDGEPGREGSLDDRTGLRQGAASEGVSHVPDCQPLLPDSAGR